MTQTSHSPKPSLEWGLGLDKEERDMFLRNLVAAPLQTQQLRRIIQAKLDTLEKREMDEKVYLDAGYPTWQAFINGKRAALLSLLELTSFIKD